MADFIINYGFDFDVSNDFALEVNSDDIFYRTRAWDEVVFVRLRKGV